MGLERLPCVWIWILVPVVLHCIGGTLSESSVDDVEGISLVLVGFRNGQTNPVELLPDAEGNAEIRREGIGLLNEFGTRQGLAIGKTLQKRYHSLLKNTYNTRNMEAYSSSSKKGRGMMQAVLAGLLPKNSRWEAVPTILTDSVLKVLKTNCRTARHIWRQIDSGTLPALRQTLLEERHLLNYIQRNTGWNTSLTSLAQLSENLINTVTRKYDLPDWIVNSEVRGYNGNQLYSKLLQFHDVREISCANHPECRTVTAGNWLEQILETLRQKHLGLLADLKLQIYSSETETVLSLMKLLDFDINYLPFSAGWILEFRNIRGPEVRLLYHRPQRFNPDGRLTVYQMRNEHCTVNGKPVDWCPLDKFTWKFMPKAVHDLETVCSSSDSLKENAVAQALGPNPFTEEHAALPTEGNSHLPSPPHLPQPPNSIHATRRRPQNNQVHDTKKIGNTPYYKGQGVPPNIPAGPNPLVSAADVDPSRFTPVKVPVPNFKESWISSIFSRRLNGPVKNLRFGPSTLVSNEKPGTIIETEVGTKPDARSVPPHIRIHHPKGPTIFRNFESHEIGNRPNDDTSSQRNNFRNTNNEKPSISSIAQNLGNRNILIDPQPPVNINNFGPKPSSTVPQPPVDINKFGPIPSSTVPRPPVSINNFGPKQSPTVPQPQPPPVEITHVRPNPSVVLDNFGNFPSRNVVNTNSPNRNKIPHFRQPLQPPVSSVLPSHSVENTPEANVQKFNHRNRNFGSGEHVPVIGNLGPEISEIPRNLNPIINRPGNQIEQTKGNGEIITLTLPQSPGAPVPEGSTLVKFKIPVLKANLPPPTTTERPKAPNPVRPPPPFVPPSISLPPVVPPSPVSLPDPSPPQPPKRPRRPQTQRSGPQRPPPQILRPQPRQPFSQPEPKTSFQEFQANEIKRCVDDDPKYCPFWASFGGCKTNPLLMLTNCQFSCRCCGCTLTTVIQILKKQKYDNSENARGSQIREENRNVPIENSFGGFSGPTVRGSLNPQERISSVHFPNAHFGNRRQTPQLNQQQSQLTPPAAALEPPSLRSLAAAARRHIANEYLKTPNRNLAWQLRGNAQAFASQTGSQPPGFLPREVYSRGQLKQHTQVRQPGYINRALPTVLRSSQRSWARPQPRPQPRPRPQPERISQRTISTWQPWEHEQPSFEERQRTPADNVFTGPFPIVNEPLHRRLGPKVVNQSNQRFGPPPSPSLLLTPNAQSFLFEHLPSDLRPSFPEQSSRSSANSQRRIDEIPTKPFPTAVAIPGPNYRPDPSYIPTRNIPPRRHIPSSNSGERVSYRLSEPDQPQWRSRQHQTRSGAGPVPKPSRFVSGFDDSPAPPPFLPAIPDRTNIRPSAVSADRNWQGASSDSRRSRNQEIPTQPFRYEPSKQRFELSAPQSLPSRPTYFIPTHPPYVRSREETDQERIYRQHGRENIPSRIRTASLKTLQQHRRRSRYRQGFVQNQ